MRLQLALNVRDLTEAIEFYSKLFNSNPHKIRPGYANFSIDSPPLKLVLFENTNTAERLNHVGVEVFEQDEVNRAQQRFESEEILDSHESEALCCHAMQNKVWAQEPQGLKWEWYRITDDNPKALQQNTAGCCNDNSANADVSTCCT